MSRSLGTKMS